MAGSSQGDSPAEEQHNSKPESIPAPPPPPPPPGHAPGLRRSSTDRYIAGVCGGLGAYFHLDALIFRVGFVLLTFAGGAGLILYMAAWVLMPGRGGRQWIRWDSLRDPGSRDTRLLLAGLIAVVAVVVLADGFQFRHEGLIWGLALVGLGAVLLLRERQHAALGFAPGAMSDQPVPYGDGAFVAPATAAATRFGAADAAPRRPRSVLGLITVATALLAVGVVALLDSTGVASLSVAAGSSIALIIVGAGLIAGAWFGRSRGLIVLGALLLPFTAAATLIKEPLQGGTGNVIVAPQTLAQLQPQYHLAAGDLTVDLSQLPLSASPNVNATLAFGKLTVIVAQQANVYVQAHAGAGHLDLLGAIDDGVNIDSPTSQTPSPGGGTIHLALSVGLGEVDVVYSTSPTPAQGQ